MPLKLFLIVTLLLGASNAFGYDSCKEMSIGITQKILVEQINADKSVSDQTVLAVINSMPSESKITAYNLISKDNAVKYWNARLKNALKNGKYNQEQREFIEKVISIQSLIQFGKIPVEQITALEDESYLIFPEDEVIQIFAGFESTSNETASSKVLNAKDGVTALSEEPVPPCNCDTMSRTKCIGCRAGPTVCYWISRGCGWIQAFPCNGKCPGL